MNPAVVKKCLVGHKFQKQTTKRPADFLEPELEKAKKDVAGITTDFKDVLTYAMYPTTGLRFLKWKHGIEEPPGAVRPKTLEQAKREDDMAEKGRKGLLVEPPSKQAPARTAATRTFNVFVDGEYFQVEVDAQDGAPRIAPAAPAPPRSAAPAGAAAPAPKPVAPAVAAPSAAPSAGAIVAPMPGLVVEYKVKIGDTVKLGDVVLILEAMKMQNEITAERAGKVASLGSSAGAQVAKGDVLAVIEPS
jgi:biotin carboxyl carrier protein